MAPVALVLAHGEDAGAHAVAAHLHARLGAGSVRLLRPESLVAGAWSHRVDGRGHADTTVRVAGGPVLASRDLRVVIHRIARLVQPRFRRASAKDRDYAGAEIEALLVSFLGAFGSRAVPDVRAQPWIAPPLPAARWIGAARAAGVPVAARPWRGGAPDPSALPGGALATAASRLLVAGPATLGDLAPVFGPACLAMSRAVGMPVLEFHFVRADDAWRLRHVDPMPPLDQPGAAERVADHLAAMAAGGHA